MSSRIDAFANAHLTSHHLPMTEDQDLDAIPAPPGLPPGRAVELAGRGMTWVHEAPGPAGAPTVVLLHGWTCLLYTSDAADE